MNARAAQLDFENSTVHRVHERPIPGIQSTGIGIGRTAEQWNMVWNKQSATAFAGASHGYRRTAEG